MWPHTFECDLIGKKNLCIWSVRVSPNPVWLCAYKEGELGHKNKDGENAMWRLELYCYMTRNAKIAINPPEARIQTGTDSPPSQPSEETKAACQQPDLECLGSRTEKQKFSIV